MPSIIYLVRHAESAHNVSKDFSHRDPPLTTAGVAQASALSATFPDPASIAVIFTSPLNRTLQTTIAGFSQVLDSAKIGGAPGGARLVVDPDLQERSDLPCDTGSDRAVLETAYPGIDFGNLWGDWFKKEGLYTADDVAVAARAQRFRDTLREQVGLFQQVAGGEGGRQNLVVITHGVFMKFLAEDDAIDLPKAGWKAFTLGEDDGNRAVLLPE